MKEYRIKICGGIDFIVISPQTLSLIISRIYESPEPELFIRVDEIMPPDFIEYLLNVINTNRFVDTHFRYSYILDDPITRQGLYQIMREQLVHVDMKQSSCFQSISRADTLTGEAGFDVDCNELFFWACKDSSAKFIYTRPDGKQETLILEYKR